MTNRLVIWVDEDERIWAPERSLLEGLGMTVIAVPDATDALRVLSGVSQRDITLVILDVMLLQGDDTATFSDAETMSGLRTGLVLGRKLVADGLCVGEKLLFFSRVMNTGERAEIAKTARSLNARYLTKSVKTQGRHFLKWLRDSGIV